LRNMNNKVIQYKLGMANGFFVRGENGVIAVDSGCELGREPFLRVCAQTGVKPADICLLVVTHGHVDHFLNIGVMKEETGAPLLCHRNAARFLSKALPPDVRPRSALGRYMLLELPPSEEPIKLMRPVEPDLVIEGTVDLKPWGVNGQIIETPGHSEGCISVVLDSGEAIVGDLLVEDPRDGSASLAFLCSFDEVEVANAKLFASAARLAECAMIFYSGHGGPFTREDLLLALTAAKAEAATNDTRTGGGQKERLGS